MKSLLVFLAALALLLFPAAMRAQDVPPPPPPDQGQGAPPPDQGPGAPPDADGQGASFQTFYDQLGNDGTWIQTDDYGYVFQPNVQDPQWAPYSDGHWVYSDEGWTWVSDEPWGWATYHYGRWANIDGLGWVWVPGYRWAPAWVSWRYGGGYAGWAPLPPEAEYGGGDFHFGPDVDVSFGIGAGCYNFVPVGYLGAPNARSYIVNRYRNYGIINHTTNITNFNISGHYGAGRAGFGGIAAGGPPLAAVNSHAHYRVPTVQLTAAAAPGRSALNGATLSIYAPRVNPATAHQGRPPTVARTISHPTFNRGTSISHPLAVTATVRPPAPTAAFIKQAKQAQAHVPATANIAHGTTHPAGASTNFHATTPAAGSTSFHSKAAETGEPAHENGPATVHHENGVATPAFHHEEAAPAVHHEESAPVVHHEESAPAFHPQQLAPHPAPAPPHAAPPPHPAGPPPGHPAPAPGPNKNDPNAPK